MKIEKVLEKLEKLLRSWGITTSDWILVANHAYKLLGYDVKPRPGHLNILVKRYKIPWKIKEGVEIHPPRNTKFRQDFKKFIEETKFDFDINLATNKEYKRKEGKYILYKLTNGRKVRLQTPLGALRELEKILAWSTKDLLGVERLDKEIVYIKGLIEVIRKRKEINTAKKFEELLKKYKKAKEKRVIIKPVGKKIISGIIASGGKVSGRVKMVKDAKDTSVLVEGDILVTTMTSPTLLVILPNIGGIVTDWGGKLSHAAILARELEVPCIVGTQIATKALKDGDLVEVDAEKGVVRKL